MGAEVEVEFNDLLANGQAVGRADGMVVFCFGPLPNERARVRITAIKPKYSVGELLQITIRSPHRAQPFCPVFGTCGGCQVQHLAYPAQLDWKRAVVRNALARIGGFTDIDVRAPIGMRDPRSYRNKMSLVVDHQSGRPRIGFYRQRSHDLVPIEGCPIAMTQLDTQIARLNAMLHERPTAPAFAQTRHIVARTSAATQKSVVTFTSAQRSAPVAAAAASLLRGLPGASGVTNSFDLSSQNAVIGRKNDVVAGSRQIEETIAGVRYRVSAGSFFQVNVEIVGKIFEFMRPRLQLPRSIVDLYCGAGTFSLFFAKLGNSVFGIEENSNALAEARDNAHLNGLEGAVHFQPGRVEDVVRCGAGAAALHCADIAFLDPPRKGSDEPILGTLAESGVPEIWYLSCDPATLARDLKFLAAKGYRPGTVQPFDMFPQTGHIETLALLHR